MKGLIEQAIIDRIKLASDTDVLPYKLKKVATYGGEFSEPDVRRIITDFPAILVMFDGARKTKQTGQSITIECRFGVFVCGQSLRSEKEALHGKDGKPGTYKMDEDIIQLLANQNFGLEIDALSYEDTRLILNDKSAQGLVSVYGIGFKTSYTLKTIPSDAELATLDDFQIFHANWDIPPHGNVSTNLPADETADATDHVEMPQ